jgi:hypothetical protein
MVEISQLVANKGGLADDPNAKGISGNEIKAVVKGKADVKGRAIAMLRLDGYITKTPHKSIQPFVEPPK